MRLLAHGAFLGETTVPISSGVWEVPSTGRSRGIEAGLGCVSSNGRLLACLAGDDFLGLLVGSLGCVPACARTCVAPERRP